MGLDDAVPLPTEIHTDPAAPIKHGGKRSEGEGAEYPNAVAANVPHAIDKYLFFELHILNQIYVISAYESFSAFCGFFFFFFSFFFFFFCVFFACAAFFLLRRVSFFLFFYLHPMKPLRSRLLH